MKQFAVLVVATLVVGTVLVGCDSKPTPQTAEDRAMSEGRRDKPDPIAPPGPPNAEMVPDEDAPETSDDE